MLRSVCPVTVDSFMVAKLPVAKLPVCSQCVGPTLDDSDLASLS